MSTQPRRRVQVTFTDERWFDINEENLGRWYGEDTSDDLIRDIEQQIYDGDGVPGWCDEIHVERYHSIETKIFGICEKHGKVMDTFLYNDRSTPGCSSCWMEGYDAEKARREGAST